MNGTELIPVRKMHDDGRITVRYLNPDGSEPEELPEEYTLAAARHTTSIWDSHRYRLLADQQNYYVVPNEITNLLHLSETSPLIFESVLQYMESVEGPGFEFFRHVMSRKKMVPTERNPDATYHDLYPALMSSADLLMELGKGYAVDMEAHNANMMFNDARKIMGGFNHPHFQAAAVAAWIIHRGTGKRAKISYANHIDGITFIHSRLDEVVASRYDLARTGSIVRSDMEQMLERPLPLRSGSL